LIYVFVIAFIVLLKLNHIVYKSILAPVMLFVGLWTVTLATLALCGDLFFPLSALTLLIYLVGAVSFSVGGMLALATGVRSSRRPLVVLSYERHHYCRVALDVLFVFCICGLPFFVHKMLDPVGGWANSSALLEARRSAVESTARTSAFSAVNNLAVLSRFVAFGLFFENDGSKARKWRAYVSLLPAIAYGSLSGSKGPAVTILLTAAFITWLKLGKVRFKSAAAIAVVCVALFSAGLLLINYAYIEFSSASQAGTRLAWEVPSYWLGGPVAFDQVVKDPRSVPSSQPIDSFFVEIADNFGAEVETVSPHAQFTTISSNLISSTANVYTIYFSYYKDYGWFGMVGLMTIAGFCLTLLYQSAVRMGPVSVLLCAMTLVATLLSFNAEHYWRGLNEYTKAVCFFWLLYHGPQIVFRSGRRSSRVAPQHSRFNAPLFIPG
jgi:oligosaccharide repeat unit polymerase